METTGDESQKPQKSKSSSKSNSNENQLFRHRLFDRIRQGQHRNEGNYYHVNQQLDLMKKAETENSEKVPSLDGNSGVLAVSLRRLLSQESEKSGSGSTFDLDFGSESYRKNTLDIIQDQGEKSPKKLKGKEDQSQSQNEEAIESLEGEVESVYDANVTEMCTLRVDEKEKSGLRGKFTSTFGRGWKKSENPEEKIKKTEKKQEKKENGTKENAAWQIASFVISIFI